MKAIRLTGAESLTLDLMITTMNDELNEALVSTEDYSPGDFKEMNAMFSLMVKLRGGVDRSPVLTVDSPETDWSAS